MRKTNRKGNITMEWEIIALIVFIVFCYGGAAFFSWLAERQIKIDNKNK